MTAASSLWEAIPASPSDVQPVPFATAYVTVTKQEHIRLVMEARSWQGLHQRAVERAQWRDERFRRVLRQLKEHAARREAVLCAELGVAQAKIRDLQQRVFGRKSECAARAAASSRPSGLVLRANLTRA